MARGNAHILHIRKTRGLNAVERLVHRHVRRRRDLIAEVSSETHRSRSISRAAVARLRGNQSRTQSLVVTAESEAIQRLATSIEDRIGAASNASVLALRPDSDARREENRIAARPDVLVTTPTRLIDHIRRDSVDLSGVTTVAIDVPTGENIEQFSADLHFIYTKLGRRPVTVALVSDLGQEFDLLEDLLRHPTTVPNSGWATPESSLAPSPPQERTMQDLPFEPEKLKNLIGDITHAIHHDEDPIELTKVRKYVRKYTNVFNRGYILAYLLKQSLEGGGSRTPRRKQQSSDKQSPDRKSRDKQSSGEKQSSPDKQSVFVSIGRSKRVRSRDLITFFTSSGALTEGDLGQVKVLDNYSFVEVAADKAQAAIEELNGQELRGRKLTVNFARRK
ncbi:MAG TPA: DbpA RNA binding domain-containing protein [Spirochaetia bacterium]|nr:DbpA RNA binding domain-containing protein [Spirochaetia bacterium]